MGMSSGTLPPSRSDRCRLPGALLFREQGLLEPMLLLRSPPVVAEDIRRMQRRESFHSQDGSIRSLSFAADGALLLYSCADGSICVWDVHRGDRERHWKKPGPTCCSVETARALPSVENFAVVSGDCEGRISVARFRPGSTRHPAVQVLPCVHEDRIRKIALEESNPYLFLTCADDGTVRQFDLRQDLARSAADSSTCCSSCLVDLRRPGSLARRCPLDSFMELEDVAIHPFQEHLVAVAGHDACIRMYDRRKVYGSGLDSEPAVRFAPMHYRESERRRRRGHVTGIAFSWNGQELLGHYAGDGCFLFDLSTSRPFECYERSDCPGSEADPSDNSFVRQFYHGRGASGAAKEAAFCGPRSEFVCVGSDEGWIFVFDKQTARCVQGMSAGDGPVSCLQTAESRCDGILLATGDSEGRVSIWATVPVAAADRSTIAADVENVLRPAGMAGGEEDGRRRTLLSGHRPRSSLFDHSYALTYCQCADEAIGSADDRRQWRDGSYIAADLL